jgi:hypothetical protein
LYVGPGEGEEAPDPIGYKQRLKADDRSTLSAYTLHEMIKPPGEGPPEHVHADLEEAFDVLEGDFTFKVGSEEIAAHPWRLRVGASGRHARLLEQRLNRRTLSSDLLAGTQTGNTRTLGAPRGTRRRRARSERRHNA